MKRIFVVLLFIAFFGCVFAQQMNDTELKNKLVKEGFGRFAFFDNGEYKYHYKEMSESLDFSGKYKIDSGIVIFETITNYDHTVIDGVECILYPQDEESKKYVLLLENLKIRKQPSTKAKVLTINGYESDVGSIDEKRNVEFAGSVLWVKAKSLKEDIIDGKSSPWYYIICSDEINNFDGWNYFGWIYGGYVKEIEQNEVEKYKNEYKPLLIKKLKEAGAKLN